MQVDLSSHPGSLFLANCAIYVLVFNTFVNSRHLNPPQPLFVCQFILLKSETKLKCKVIASVNQVSNSCLSAFSLCIFPLHFQGEMHATEHRMELIVPLDEILETLSSINCIFYWNHSQYAFHLCM